MFQRRGLKPADPYVVGEHGGGVEHPLVEEAQRRRTGRHGGFRAFTAAGNTNPLLA